MKVFRACMLIMNRRFTTYLIYLMIFLALSIIIPAMSEEQFNTDFSTMKPNITVINRDGDTPLSDGLLTYLREYGNEVALDDDKTTLQDATFFHATDYIVFLPQGFHDSFIAGENVTLDKVVTTETAKGYYADRLVGQYLNLARSYLSAGLPMGEDVLAENVLRDLSLSVNTEKVQFGDSAPIAFSYLIFNRMLPYILLVLNILFVTNITMVFKRTDLRMRNMCSPLRTRTLSVQQILRCSIMCVAAWLVMSVVGLIMYGGSLAGVDGRVVALVLLNSFVFTITALSIAALLGTITSSPNAQNAAANLVGLGLCFLGGVFVPLEMLGDGMLAVSRFLPTYWNVSTLDAIGSLTSFEASKLVPVWQALLIQLAFAAAFFCLTLVISKQQNQSEKSFGSVRTELEA